MIPLTVTLNLELDPWADLAGQHLHHATVERIGMLPDGTDEHRACVEILARLNTGQLVVIETTWRLFATAALALGASPVAQLEDL